MDTSDLIVTQIEIIRGRNNTKWMDLLRLAVKAAPDDARAIIRDINENDRQVSTLLGILADEL